MQQSGCISEFEEIDDHRGGKIVVQLNGQYVVDYPDKCAQASFYSHSSGLSLNKCVIISPRFKV